MYFDNFTRLDDIKNMYRTLSKRLHPDMGGDKTIMAEINTYYEMAVNRLTKSKPRFVDNTREKILKVMAWSEDHPYFDDTFVCSLLKRLDSGRELSDAQVNSLNNIINKFKIETGV